MNSGSNKFDKEHQRGANLRLKLKVSFKFSLEFKMPIGNLSVGYLGPQNKV